MKKNNKGFTLAELLIVVAIIAVLVAIAIPVFTSQLEKARESSDQANLRSAYAQQMTWILTWDGTATPTPITVHAQQTKANWQSGPTGNDATIKIANGIEGAGIDVNAVTKGNDWTVSVDTTGTEPKVTITTGSSGSGEGGGT